MEDGKKRDNVILFPVGKREVPPPLPKAPKASHSKDVVKPKGSKATLGGAVLAVILATAAMNHYAFSVSVPGSSQTRGLASVGGSSSARDAKWEMALSERLASAEVREVASLQVGHSPTLEEKLRLGTLDDVKYSFLKPESGKITAIVLQGAGSEPDYIGDRGKFLKEYGTLLGDQFSSAQLKAVEMSNEKSVEQYTLFDKDLRPMGEAHFELDKHQRLLSLKVEPLAI